MTAAPNKSILTLMIILFFAIVFGLGLAFFATQNTNSVTLTIASITLSDIPLWGIVIASLLAGLILASYFNVLSIITSALKLHGKDAAIKGADKTISSLKKEIQDLKVENASLKSKKEPIASTS